MPNLYFENPTFNKGRNVTVRRGVKWAIAEAPECGFPIINTKDPITEDGKDKIIGFAVNVERKVKRFSDIEFWEIEDEHDEKCRSYRGLHEEMVKLYPKFSTGEIVTILEFEVK